MTLPAARRATHHIPAIGGDWRLVGNLTRSAVVRSLLRADLPAR